MRSWIVVLAMLLILGSFTAGVSASTVSAGESISTDRSIYVMGDIMTITVHGENSTTYTLRVNGNWLDVITTNNTGVYIGNYSVTTSNDFHLGDNTISLERGNVHVETHVTVREGLHLWPSEYTHTTNYIGGEVMWVRISGENNKTYQVNITNATGSVGYPSSGGSISVTTDNEGVAVFNITLNIGDGDYDINLYNGTRFIQSKAFSIRSVDIVASIDKGRNGVYLMSEKIHAYVSIYWLKTHTLLNNIKYKWWIVDYYNTSLTFGPYVSTEREFDTYSLNTYETGTGDKIEVNSRYLLKIEYDMTNDTGRHYAVTTIPFYTGELSANIDLNALDGSLSPGKRAMIEVSTYARYSHGASSPLGNVKIDFVNITITKHWSTLWTANYTDYGYTDESGNAYLIWRIPEVETGSEVRIKVGVSINNEKRVVTHTDWIVSYLKLVVNTDKDFYLAGETMNVEIHSYSPEGISVLGYDVRIMASGKLFYYESTTSNNVRFTVPTNYSGTLHVSVMATFSNGETKSDDVYVDVYYGYIYLSASQDYYFHAGDEITIYSEFRSNVMHPTYLNYKILDDRSRVIMTLNASLNSFTFRVPSENSDEYTIMAEAIDGSYYASNTLTIYKFEGYFLTTSIVTKSKYQSMVYEPGQTIKIAYNITKYGNFTPHVVVLHWAIVNTNYHWEKVLGDGEMSGTVSLKIPSDLRGGYSIEVWVSDSEGTPSTWNLLTINVEKGTWAMQDIAGMPMLSFINLVLVIVAIVIGVVAILMLLRGRKGGIAPITTTKKKGPPKPYTPEEPEEEEVPASPQEEPVEEEGLEM